MIKRITKEKLENMYRTMLVKEMSKKLGVSRQTIYTYLKQAKINLRGKGKKIIVKS
jgi:transposase